MTPWPAIPRGHGAIHEVMEAQGRAAVATDIVNGKRKVLVAGSLGIWRPFPGSLDFWATASSDEPSTTGAWSYRQPPSPIFNKVLVVVSLLPTDKAWKPEDADTALNAAAPEPVASASPTKQSEPVQSERKLTPLQERLFAIFDRELTGKQRPDPQRPSDWAKLVKGHWKAELQSRGESETAMPDRGTITRAADRWCRERDSNELSG
jgi:hypothetical protein